MKEDNQTMKAIILAYLLGITMTLLSLQLTDAAEANIQSAGTPTISPAIESLAR